MERVAVVLVIVAVVGLVALVVQRRRVADAPTQRHHSAPDQLDRGDFPRPDAPWLVAVFSAATCNACAEVLRKAQVLESAEVAVAEIEYSTRRDLHERYSIDAVPTLVVADDRGVVVAAFLGPMTATDLWATVAEARAPGSSPTGGHCGRHDRPD
jgi:hypothetical protein